MDKIKSPKFRMIEEYISVADRTGNHKFLQEMANKIIKNEALDLDGKSIYDKVSNRTRSILNNYIQDEEEYPDYLEY